MHKLNDLTNQLNDYLQISLFTDYCPNGMQVEGKKEVKKIATAVSASLHIIEEAVKHKVDLLIVHHGIFWQGDNPIIEGAKREKLRLLLTHDISLAAYHLPLDAHREIGNNWKAAMDLGWSNLAPFYQVKGPFIGVKGNIERQSREAFQKSLENYYGQKAITALGGKKEVETVALISGGAYKQTSDAAAQGIDCFVTGNFDEPAWHLAHEDRINFFAMGHHATERIGPRALADYLRTVYKLEALFLDQLNPF